MKLNQLIVLVTSVSWLVNSVVVAVPPVNVGHNYGATASDQAAASSSITVPVFDTEIKITASDAASGDAFGVSVSVSGDTAIVGARGADPGSAYIFRRNLGGINNWGEVTILTASDGGRFDKFGYSVSIRNDLAIVGAESVGAAYIFHRNQGGIDNWGEVIKLTKGGAFGRSVAISGDTAVVGNETEEAFIFQRDSGGISNWGEVTMLTASDTSVDDRFGWSVSISGDMAIVGAWTNDTAGTDSGSAYIYGRDQGGIDNWGEITKLTASDAASGDVFGKSVSINKDTAIVGAWENDDAGLESGSAYIFQRNLGGADDWGELTKLTASDAGANDHFGVSVSLSNDTTIIGAYADTVSGSQIGSVYIYGRDQGGIDNWGEVTKLTAPDAAHVDHFGVSVSISGSTIITGAHGNDDVGTSSGSAYIFISSSCGDGTLDPGEACDDGNNDSCDGCRGDCSAVEAVVCGDGVIDPICETCDDSNTDHCDGCSADCQLENNCDDSMACSVDTCDLALGCQNDLGECVLPPASLTGEAGFTKDRYISFDPTSNGTIPVAIRVTRVGSATDRYVDCTTLADLGADGWYAALIDGPLPAPGDTTYYCDMSGVPELHVRGCNIVTGNTYDVEITINGTYFSSSFPVDTTPPHIAAARQFGDITGGLVGGIFTAPDGLVTIIETVTVLFKFQLVPTAPIIARVNNTGVVPNTIVTSADVLRAVQAFAGEPFGYGVTDCLTGTCVPPQGGECE